MLCIDFNNVCRNYLISICNGIAMEIRSSYLEYVHNCPLYSFATGYIISVWQPCLFLTNQLRFRKLLIFSYASHLECRRNRIEPEQTKKTKKLDNRVFNVRIPAPFVSVYPRRVVSRCHFPIINAYGAPTRNRLNKSIIISFIIIIFHASMSQANLSHTRIINEIAKGAGVLIPL